MENIALAMFISPFVLTIILMVVWAFNDAKDERRYESENAAAERRFRESGPDYGE